MSEALKTPEPQQAEPENAPAKAVEQATEVSPQVEKKTPSKRQRLSFIQRAQLESEELVKTLGGSLEMEGGRRTRSSARGTPTRPAATPPPVKKSRNSPASPKTAAPRGKGRGLKLDTSVTPEPPEPKAKSEKEAKKEKEQSDVSKVNKPDVDQPEKIETSAADEKLDEPIKTKESSETNGPEKVVVEKDNVDSAEKAIVDKTAEKPNESKAAADQVDADKKLASIEEKPSKELVEKSEDEKSKVLVSEASAVPADSPMEVDEQSKSNEEVVATKIKETKTNAPAEQLTVEKCNEEATPATASPVKHQLEKQPTPEPMEVDSSSKSSDVVECTDVVDKADETAEVKSTTNYIASTNSHASAADKPADVPLPPLKETEHELKNEINANVKANDIPAVKSIEEPVAVGEPHVDNNKNEHDIDQQLEKAASQLSAATAVVGGDALTTSL